MPPPQGACAPWVVPWPTATTNVFPNPSGGQGMWQARIERFGVLVEAGVIGFGALWLAVAVVLG